MSFFANFHFIALYRIGYKAAETAPSVAETTVKPRLMLKVKPSKRAEKTATDEPFDPLLTLDHADDADEAESELEAESLGESSDENSEHNS